MTPITFDAKTRLELIDAAGNPQVYVLERPLGHGANSQTFLAQDDAEQWVAIKTPRYWEQGDEDLQIEERLLGQLQHENLVPLLATGFVQRQRVLAYPLLRENPLTLLSRLRDHFPDDPGTRYYPLPARIALGLGLDLLSGLSYLHERGFVHHDVKPSNIMVDLELSGPSPAPHLLLEGALRGDARGVLIDVGGSRAQSYLDDLNSGRADADVSVVAPQLSPLYAPPEALVRQVRGGEKRIWLDPSLDLYAAALVVYTMLTGRAPYDHLNLVHHDLETLTYVKRQELSGRLFPFAAEAVRGARGARRVSEELVGWLTRCTSPDLQQRPEVMEGYGELAMILETFQGGALSRERVDQELLLARQALAEDRERELTARTRTWR